MANPQLENGHTRVANEILEQITKVSLNGTQYRIVLTVWRWTYGFQRKEYELSSSFIAKYVEASRTQIDRELKTLIDRNIINVNGIGSKGARIMSFNKNYKEWGNSENKRTSSLVEKPEAKAPEEPKKQKKQKKDKYDEENTYYKMALYFHERVSIVAKEAGVQHLIKKANLQSWADDFRKLVEIDGIDKRLAKEVMDWVTTDSFWKTNVLSAKKFREKFGELAIKMKANQTPKHQQKTKAADPRDREIAFNRWIAEGNDPNEFNWGS